MRRVVHVAAIERHYSDLGVAEGSCDVHGVYHVARASLAMGLPMECIFCRAEERAAAS